jgi:EAL domain-containing protein (putative c-di-GMP-specific phosphodiesterase class I)
MLVVRLCGDTVPRSWNRWGRPLSDDSHRIWAFPLPAMMDLADLVEALVLETPAELRSTCLAVCIDPDFDGRLPLSVLDELEPLTVLHTRLHEPWIMGPLGHLVKTSFQPIVTLKGKGVLVGYQLPCHLEHPERGSLTGASFYALARDARRLEEVDQACQISALLRKSESLPAGVPAFVSALPQSLLWGDLRRHPSYTCLDRLGLDPGDIVIEVVQRGQVDDVPALVRRCQDLRAMGFRIALADFGAGLGQVGLLSGLEPEFIRFDTGLIREAQSTAAGATLLEGLVAMARRLGASSIADGLDGEEELQICREIGIDCGQGGLIAPVAPVPLAPAPLPEDGPSRFRVRG